MSQFVLQTDKMTDLGAHSTWEFPCVYVFKGGAGEVLYVGQTRNFAERWRDHKRTKAWFGAISQVLVWQCDSPDMRLEQEGHLILALRPRYNKAMMLGLAGDGSLYALDYRAAYPRKKTAKTPKRPKKNSSATKLGRGSDPAPAPPPAA